MTDAGSALILCREEILRAQKDKPQVYVTATAMASGSWYAASDTLEDAYNLLAKPAEKAYAMAGLTPQDMDVAEIYNSFAIQESLGVESLGFAKMGEGWKCAADGSTWKDGAVAVNMSGGLLCKGHPLGCHRHQPGGRRDRAAARHGTCRDPARGRRDRHLGLSRRTGCGRRHPHLPAAGGLR